MSLKDSGQPRRADLLFYQRESLALPFGNAPGQAAHFKTVLAQNPADAARVLANLVCHDDGFIPVRLQLPQFRGDFAVQYVNRTSNMACVEIRFIAYIKQNARPIIEDPRALMAGNGQALLYPPAPGLDAK